MKTGEKVKDIWMRKRSGTLKNGCGAKIPNALVSENEVALM